MPVLDAAYLQGLCNARPILVCGAGCSARAMIPTWVDYLDHLAAFAHRHEPDLASLMRKRVREGAFLVAATLFKRFLSAPPADKLAALSEPFRQDAYDHRPLLALASLPFSAVITTNYDGSLFEAISTIASQRSDRHPHLLTTKDTKGAAFMSDRFFLFLHGQASVPLQAEHMIFDEDDYKRLYSDPPFTDGLLAILSNRTCVFLGFSFLDPGLNALLKLWTDLKGQAFPRKHYALLPDNQNELAYKLTQMNVEVATYNKTADHSNLWDSVRDAASALTTQGREEALLPPPPPAPHHAARDILAMTYTRSRLGKTIQPLRNIVIDGVVLALLTAAGGPGLTAAELYILVGRQLGIPIVEIEADVVAALQRLERLSAVTRVVDRLLSTESVTNPLAKDTARLARQLIQRICVREGIELPEVCVPTLARLFEDLFVARAWDLAAHFIQPRLGISAVLVSTVDRILSDSGVPPGIAKPVLKRSLLELLERPSSDEAMLLSELGRLAFAIQLALSHARTTYCYAATLPHRVYLDASVLMPAIVEGHPLYSVYHPVLRRLRDQVHATGGEIHLLTAFEFLNEIIHHRELAIAEVRDHGLEVPERLQREALLLGAQNLNVFIGAYATHVGRARRKIAFSQFLRESAPFDTEERLEQWLGARGIEVVHLADSAGFNRPPRLWEWFNALRTEYEQANWLGRRPKPAVLVEHEAWQMFQLERDHEGGIRSIFVTADGRLRRVVGSVFNGRLGDALLSGVNMVNLVDLLLGVRIDHRGLARLVWGVYALDTEGKIRQYFTDKGLAVRGELETVTLPKVVDRITADITADPSTEKFAAKLADAEDRAAFVDYLDRFEDRFYSLLQAAVKDRLAKEGATDHVSKADTSRSRKRRSRRRKGR